MSATSEAAFYRSRDLDRRIPVCRTTLWRWVKAGTFPAPIRMGNSRVLFWDAAAVEAWIAAQRGVTP